MKELTLGYSPCPNDTFIFHAMIHRKIDTGPYRFREVLLDVETLNQKALNAELDLTKISYHAYGHLRDDYCMLRAGGALGRGCGPLVIVKNDISMKDLRNLRIAIPGKLTTASLLLQLYYASSGGRPSSLIEMPFHTIMEAVANGEVDAGLIIHESRFTFPSYGLVKVLDLGEWWEHVSGLPIPLGGIIAKRSLGEKTGRDIDRILKQSVEHAFQNRTEPMDYIKKHSQELSDDVIREHINLYVNPFSVDVGDEGMQAVTELLSRAEEAGIISPSKKSLFI